VQGRIDPTMSDLLGGMTISPNIGLEEAMEDSHMSPNDSPAVDDVLSVIRDLGQQNAALELTKSYRGLVLQQDVSILEVNPNDVTFRTTDIEMSAVLEGDVYLHNQLFPKPVMAQFKNLDLRKGTLVLSGFAYIDNEWKNRQHERVRPKHPTYVTLHWKKKAVRAYMENISVNGMRILGCKIFESGMRIQPGSTVHLDFQLSPGHNYTAIKGTIIYLNAIGRYTTIGIRLFPTAKVSRLLEKHIAPRKQEILEELKQAYRELIMPTGVESLYF